MNYRLILPVAVLVTVSAFAMSAHADDFDVKGGAVGSTTSAVSRPKGSAKPKGPSQASVAGKSTFPVVKASDARLKGALDAKNLSAAQGLVGKNAVVVGTVTKVYLPKSNSVVLLNFAKDYKTALVGAISAKDFSQFPALAGLTNKKVMLSGKIVNFKGAPEIELSKAGSISIIK